MLLAGLGRSVIVDQGYYPFVFRLLLRVVEPVFLTEVLVAIAESVNDFKFMKAATASDKAKAATAVAAPGAKPAAAAPAAAAPKRRGRPRAASRV